MVSEETRREVYDLANGRCENCGRQHAYFTREQALNGLSTWEWHHRFFKSEYRGKDRDESWNGAVLCCDSICDCHKNGKEAVHNGNKKLNEKLKQEADRRRPRSEREGGVHEDLTSNRKTRQKRYKADLEKYKKDHNGLSPSQVLYRKQKEWIKNRKKSVDFSKTI